MYKKILVISDNPVLCKRFERLIGAKKFDSVRWTFSVGPGSDINDYKIMNTGIIKQYNLKDDQDVDEIIKNFDLVFSLHCKQIFPVKLVKALKCINIHPGYNPVNRGWYPNVFSIIYDLPIGATIHEIDEELDHGKIINQVLVDKYLFDTGETLYRRVIKEEMKLLARNMKNIIDDNYAATKPDSEGKLFLKKDFDDLKEINLEEQSTMMQLINKLRALTYSGYKNAYFVDPATRKKIFISLNIELEEDR